jgi:hypothetical protein
METCNCNRSQRAACAGGGAVYGLGLVGAAVYYIQHASTFWMGVMGIVKAVVWPALLLYKLLGFLGM